MGKAIWLRAAFHSLTLNSFGAKFHICRLLFFFFFFFFSKKLSLGKKFIRKVERLNVKQHRSRSHLDLCCLLKPIIMPVAVKELKR